ncbi:MAG: undecaprenyldiphospho-muramoylpentapeptide beta-N-acetylglucosaminyltransferase [Paenibacillaceae bacterium]|nr:undecaprenyldiphospho-muramoylpentapeptide beta-N-acetylglucosaminyltransferase [Paenibacillaceae bacterium]
MKRTIVLTGGGSAGHVMVHEALMPLLHAWDVHYIGTHTGIEREMMRKYDVRYYAIAAGRLRRYVTWKHVREPFYVCAGFVQALRLLRRVKPHGVFAKGGFVSVPVALAAAVLRIPLIVHESDWSPGLANRLCAPFARVICTTFAQTKFSSGRVVHIGAVVRASLLRGIRARGLASLSFSGKRPIVLVVGGSLGSRSLNAAVRNVVPQLCAHFDVVHVCGKGNVVPHVGHDRTYVQREFVQGGWEDILACADVVVSRAGSNAIWELVRLRKPMVLVPLGTSSSRGDQIENAAQFARDGAAFVLPEHELAQQLVSMVHRAYDERTALVRAMEAMDGNTDALDQLAQLIESVCTQSNTQEASK